MSGLEQRPRAPLATGAPDELTEETLAVGRELGLAMYDPALEPVDIAPLLELLDGVEIAASAEQADELELA